MKSLIGFAVLMLLGMLQPAAATTQELEKAVFVALHVSDSERMPPAQRRELAAAALAYWKHFVSRVPHNSPANAEWLSGELNTTDTERLSRAINSPAYGLWKLEDMASNCVDTFEQLATVIGGDKAIELYLWLKATRCYSDSGTAHYLQIAGLSDGTSSGTFKMQTFSMVPSAITGKLANTVINE